MKSRIIFGFAVLVLLYGKCISQNGLNSFPSRPVEAYLFWNSAASSSDSVDQESFASALASMGFPFTRIDGQQLDSIRDDRHALLVIPFPSARLLSNSQAGRILKRVRDGLCMITDGPSSLTDALNINLGPPVRVSSVTDELLPNLHLYWTDHPRVQWLDSFPRAQSKVLYVDSSGGKPLGISLRHGKGKLIFIATPFDSISGHGYSRFSTLGNAIVRELQCRQMCRRNAIDAYFDPGFRYDLPIEKLAAMWRQWGIHAVHAAAWYRYDSPPYDYRRLIRAAHENGILVYAWLEWPYVGTGFWKQHPEWRAKNALLQDAEIEFLQLMDLQKPECLKTALNDLELLLKEDWDGVDVAEFTITGSVAEALSGPLRPDYFVGFGSTARAEFKQIAGFDPLELEDLTSRHYWVRDTAALDQFYRYRTTVNNRLLRQVVEFVAAFKSTKKRDWELINTIIDNSLHPEFDYLLGFDLASTLRLLNELDVTLNVEDPLSEWTQPPSRYRQLRTTLGTSLPGRRSMIDINVVPVHSESQTGFASAQATGFELYEQIQSASEQRGRVCLYCESSVFRYDWQLIPNALSAGSKASKKGLEWNVNSPNTVVLTTGVQAVDVMLDGKPWPCIGSQGVIVPSGNHRISFSPKSSTVRPEFTHLRLIAISDELLKCSMKNEGIELTYESAARCLLTLSNNPVKIFVDDSPVNLRVVAGKDGFVLIAPSGQHKLFISAQ